MLETTYTSKSLCIRVGDNLKQARSLATFFRGYDCSCEFLWLLKSVWLTAFTTFKVVCLYFSWWLLIKSYFIPTLWAYLETSVFLVLLWKCCEAEWLRDLADNEVGRRTWSLIYNKDKEDIVNALRRCRYSMTLSSCTYIRPSIAWFIQMYEFRQPM